MNSLRGAKMLNKTSYLIVIALLSWQCTGTLTPEEAQNEKILPLSLVEKQVVKSSNEFGLKVFKEIVSTSGDSNIIISPLSVSMALGMTLNGADGGTYDAMQSTLSLEGLSEEEINLSYQNLIKLLIQLDPEVIFEIANSIWCRFGFQVEQEFIDINKLYFNAEVTGLDFTLPSAIDIMNQWVNDKTHGKIEEIIERIDVATVMFLINAIYFKGTWNYQFDEELTADADFYISDGSPITCRMMQQKWEHYYLENENFQAVDLPYGKGNFRMTLFLPKPEHDLDSFIASLNPQIWESWLSSFTKDSVNLFLPKFKLEYKLKMNDVLTHLGMGIAFSPALADFSRIRSSGGLWIDKVFHKTFVEVNEEGTEAAAVTVVEIKELSADGDHEIYMRINQPFLCVIRENSSNTILFIGKIVKPVWEANI